MHPTSVWRKTVPQKKKTLKHIALTSHPNIHGEKTSVIRWGASSAEERGPLIATLTDPKKRNVIGTHAGSYMIYRALAIAAGALDPEHKPDLTNTSPATAIGPHPSWFDPQKIVSLDPFGADIAHAFKKELSQGIDIRPTIAITKAHISMPELQEAMLAGRLHPDGQILSEDGSCVVTKAAIEPAWFLPGIAQRFGIEEGELRRNLFEHTGGMFPELITRPDLCIFMPPIGGNTVYIFGDPQFLGQEDKRVACRVHDECNGSDVFGSDICTCRPYLTHGIEVCIAEAQAGGVGVVVYNRKEGRALGEVTKFLVYNARKRQEGGDTAASYFARTECVAGLQDMRFQELMPDVLHWLGIRKIHRFVSMSNMKYDALIKSGIEVEERVSIPEDLIPQDARVEMDAKKAAGYYTEQSPPHENDLKKTKGRALHE